jgi:methylase of polypeptide subunit release factors
LSFSCSECLSAYRYIGPDSLGLVHSSPTHMYASRLRVSSQSHTQPSQASPTAISNYRYLDLCTGSGVQVLSCLHTHKYQLQTATASTVESPALACLVDLNPRAVRFATANAILNGLEEHISVLVRWHFYAVGNDFCVLICYVMLCVCVCVYIARRCWKT